MTGVTPNRPALGRPWLIECRCPDARVRKQLRAIPGVAWDGMAQVLLVPTEVLSWLK